MQPGATKRGEVISVACFSNTLIRKKNKKKTVWFACLFSEPGNNHCRGFQKPISTHRSKNKLGLMPKCKSRRSVCHVPVCGKKKRAGKCVGRPQKLRSGRRFVSPVMPPRSRRRLSKKSKHGFGKTSRSLKFFFFFSAKFHGRRGQSGAETRGLTL